MKRGLGKEEQEDIRNSVSIDIWIDGTEDNFLPPKNVRIFHCLTLSRMPTQTSQIELN
jgi:hypothetical protein